MLDYAANAVAYLPVDALRAAFAARCIDDHVDSEGELCGLLGAEHSSDEFWQKVKTNLQAGRIRLVFVADEIPPELRRIVEFLNQQMDPAEVLAVEIRQYLGGTFRTLVPRVFGQTEQAQQKKGLARPLGVKWDESRLLEELRSKHGEEDSAVASQLLAWGRARNAKFDYGSGVSQGSVFFVFEYDGNFIWPIAIWTYGKIEVQFQHILKSAAFQEEQDRRELQRRLNAIEGVRIPDEALTRRPSIALSVLQNEERRRQFIDVLDWVVGRFRGSV
jgi:hypothetical protein